MHPSILISLHSNKIQEEMSPILGKAQTGKDKTDLAKNFADGKRQFSHAMF
jgi:hypothetical protein